MSWIVEISLSTPTLLAPATGASGGRKVEMDKLLLMYWMFSEGHALTLVVMDWWVGGLCPPQLIIFYVVEYGGNAKQSSITSFATSVFHVPAVSSFYHGRQQSLRCHILSFLSYIITLKIILFNFSEH